MATITGFTAERMEEMEAATIVSGEIVGDDLILTKHDDSTVNAGNVRGPTGSPGVTEEELEDVFASLLPVGAIVDYINTTPPANWLAMTGQTITNGQTLNPALWAVIPASMKSGANIIMPDTRGKVAVGYNSSDTDFDTILETGGAKTHTLTQAQLPAAPVTVDPPSTSVTGNSLGRSAAHTHTVELLQTASVQAGTGASVAVHTGDVVQTATEVTDHVHAAGSLVVNIAPFNSGNMGSGASHPIVQPYVVFLKIIKAL